MITKKELQYVDAWANKTPMPGVEYSLIVLQYIKKCIDIFNSKYRNKEYNIVFSNGEEINLEIQEKNLCHMLGIDYNNIRGDYFDYFRDKVFGSSSTSFSSYNLLEMILENAVKVAEADNDPYNKAKAINYYKSRIKCEIFEKLCDFSSFNYAAINYTGEDNQNDTSKQKALFVPSNEPICPYFMMHTRLDIDNNKFVPTSLMAPIDPIKYFKNQEVIIPTQALIIECEDSDMSAKLIKKEATPEEKIKLLTLYKSIINAYQLPNRINIYGDYEAMLKDEERNKAFTLK